MALNAFVPDRDASFYLLSGHLPPVAENVARAYIEAYTAPGDLVLDPFAHAPSVARAAAASGRRAIAVESNSLAAFVARVQASPPTARALEDALLKLGDSPKAVDPRGRRFAQPGNETPGRDEVALRDHLEGLYATTCGECGERVVADEFLYSPEIDAPVEKEYTCPKHGPRREATNDADRAAAAAFERRGFHYHYVWTRVTEALGGDLNANTVRDLLALYSPRALYALVTLWLKIESQLPDDPVREGVIACFIHALDRATLLYGPGDPWPARKIPARAIERNVWRLVAEAGAELGGAAGRLALRSSPKQVWAAGDPCAYVGRGSTRQLAAEMLGGDRPASGAALILTMPPRLDPLFWGLSYLWTRWIWGKKEAEPLAAFLDAERHRWPWYAEALTGALRAAEPLLNAEGRLVAVFPAGSHGVVEALCLAAGAVPLHLETLLFRPHRGAILSSEFGALRGDYRVSWTHAVPQGEVEAGAGEGEGSAARGPKELARQVHEGALRGGREVLEARGEPLCFSWLHHAALARLAQTGLLAQLVEARLAQKDNSSQFLRRELNAGLKEGYTTDFDHWPEVPTEATGVLWFRRERQSPSTPLAERVEGLVRELFRQHPQISRWALEDSVLAEFREWETPEIELVEAVAGAYAELEQETWVAREGPAAERDHALDTATRLAERLGFEVAPGKPPFDLEWLDLKTIPGSASGAVSETQVREHSHSLLWREQASFRDLLAYPLTQVQGVVLVSNRQTKLFQELARRWPVLTRRFFKAGWNLLLVEQAERALEWEDLQRRHWRALLGLAPEGQKGEKQLELFE